MPIPRSTYRLQIRESFDLRAAAKELTPTFSDSYGEGGISMIAMQKRYGEWKKPA